MKRTALALAALALVGSALLAQLLPPPRAQRPQGNQVVELGGGIAAGFSSPLRDFGKTADAGFQVTAFLTSTPPLAPIGDRLEGSVSQFQYPGTLGSSGGHVRILSLAMNGLINTTGPLHPYVIGGIGLYHASSTCGGCTSTWTRPGGNVGVGVQFGLGGVRAFCEVRGHFIADPEDPARADLNTGTWFVPVSFGVKF